jgi:hypothetical protein
MQAILDAALKICAIILLICASLYYVMMIRDLHGASKATYIGKPTWSKR